jgi:pyrroloquinoline quinone biosynthesis protein E
LRNRLLTRWQQRLLGAFSRLSALGLGDRVAARAARRLVGGYLYSVKLEVNTACDLSCPMCYVERSGRELPRAWIDRLFDDLAGAGVRIEILGGEPLLRRDIVELVAAARRRARSPLVSLYTNGTRATPALCRSLGEAGLGAAIVSVVSPRPERHDRFVGRAGAWRAALAACQLFRDAGVATYTFTAVHGVNVEDVRAIDELARGLGVGALFFPYVPRRANDPLAIAPAAWRRVKRWALAEANPEHGAFVRDFFMLTGNACSGGNFVLTVKADGSVQPCPFIDDLPLGDVGVEGIWRIFGRRFALPALVEFKSTPAECTACSYASVCAGGCRAGNRRVVGSYARRDTRCQGPFRGPIVRAEVCDRVPCFF